MACVLCVCVCVRVRACACMKPTFSHFSRPQLSAHGEVLTLSTARVRCAELFLALSAMIDILQQAGEEPLTPQALDVRVCVCVYVCVCVCVCVRARLPRLSLIVLSLTQLLVVVLVLMVLMVVLLRLLCVALFFPLQELTSLVTAALKAAEDDAVYRVGVCMRVRVCVCVCVCVRACACVCMCVWKVQAGVDLA